MSFVPSDFVIPERLETPDFTIRKLCVADTALDYEAVMSSIDFIRRVRDETWPTASLTYAEDESDLAEHEREFAERTSFTYTVMSPDESACLGCIYIYPGGARGEKTRHADADISFWVTEDAARRGGFPKLYHVLESWLATDWPFRTHAYSNAELPAE